ALTSGGEVFIPASLDELTAWPTSTGGAKYGIKTGAFFTPGVFSPEKLVTTTSGGSRFKFFGLNADFSTGTPITGPDQFDQRAHPEFKGFTFEVKTGYLRNIFSKGFGVEMSGETALFHKVFQEIYLWQPYPGVEKPTYFKPAVGEKLYDYYYQQ
ncbi:MAG: hypothetical protein LBT13_01950, partial [Treponema sp.]|nr:hypothetical protein [Treponema sp.]